MGNITKDATARGRRTRFYLKHIEACLDAQRFGPRQRERIESVGRTKLQHYVRFLDRDNYERWTAFAKSNPVESVEQAARRGRPAVPREPVRSFVLRIPEPLRDRLREAIEGRMDGGRAVDGAVDRLLRDAARGRR